MGMIAWLMDTGSVSVAFELCVLPVLCIVLVHLTLRHATTILFWIAKIFIAGLVYIHIKDHLGASGMQYAAVARVRFFIILFSKRVCPNCFPEEVPPPLEDEASCWMNWVSEMI